MVGKPKYRFDAEIIELLEKLKWWDMNIDEIKEIIPIITKGNITKEEIIRYINHD